MKSHTFGLHEKYPDLTEIMDSGVRRWEVPPEASSLRTLTSEVATNSEEEDTGASLSPRSYKQDFLANFKVPGD